MLYYSIKYDDHATTNTRAVSLTKPYHPLPPGYHLQVIIPISIHVMCYVMIAAALRSKAKTVTVDLSTTNDTGMDTPVTDATVSTLMYYTLVYYIEQ